MHQILSQLRRTSRVSLAAVALGALSCAVAQAQTGSVDIQAVNSTFSSPTGAYGPWTAEDLNVRFGPQGSTGIEVLNRHASDRFNPITEQFYQIDNYHAWSNHFTSYVAAAYGSGAPFYRDRFIAEGDVRVKKGLVLVGGVSVGQQYLFGSAHQAILGTDYYVGDNYVSLRYRPTWSAELGDTQGYSAALSLGHAGRSTHTFRVGGGGENDASLINPLNPALVGERTFDVSYSYKHWLDASRGFHLDVDTGTLQRTGGAEIYKHLDLGLGYFFALR